LSALIDATIAESDLIYRGADIRTETPGNEGGIIKWSQTPLAHASA
jgi:hypothetical protein